MARVTRVQKARQRFKTVPVLNEDGTPKRTPVMKTVTVRNEETGEFERVQRPKTTKTGREVTMAVTVQDKTQPLPNLRCDFSGCDIDGGEILPGTSYKHITPRSGPYGGSQRNRHDAHADWKIWEYSHSRAAQVARTQSDMHDAIDSWEPTAEDDFDALRDELQSLAQEAADEAREALDNMPESLQDGSQAAENADALESWVEGFDSVESPGAEFLEECAACDGSGEIDATCDACTGEGAIEDGIECGDCDGDGQIREACYDCDGGASEVVSADWLEEARDALREATDEAGI